MLISIAICTHQRYGDLAACLASLRQQSLDVDQREILVMDNSPDRAVSQRMMVELGDIPGLRWFHLDRTGVSHARNRAVEQARAPLVAFVDDDITVAPGWLAALLDGFGRFGDAAHSAGGPVRANWPQARPAWLADGMLPFLAVIDRGPDIRLLEQHEWIPTANAAFRIDRLRAAGGFRERLGRFGGDEILLANEDTEIVDRMHMMGGHTAWLPGAEATHRIDASRLDHAWFRRRFAWQAISDFMVHPDHHRSFAADSWREATEYLKYMAMPGIDAFATVPTQPEFCHWQMSSIYHLVLGLLAGVPPEVNMPDAMTPGPGDSNHG